MMSKRPSNFLEQKIVSAWQNIKQLTPAQFEQLACMVLSSFSRYAHQRFYNFDAASREDMVSAFVEKKLGSPMIGAQHVPLNTGYLKMMYENHCLDHARQLGTWFKTHAPLSEDGERDDLLLSAAAPDEICLHIEIAAEKFIEDVCGQSMALEHNRATLFHLAFGLASIAGDKTMPRKGQYPTLYGFRWNKKLALRLGADQQLIRAYLDEQSETFVATLIGQWLVANDALRPRRMQHYLGVLLATAQREWAVCQLPAPAQSATQNALQRIARDALEHSRLLPC